MEDQFYIISLKHSHKRERYITFWRPDDKGYCWKLSLAGKYGRANVMAHLGYYNSGCSNIAVPCSVVDALTVMTAPADMIDGPDAPAVLNTPAKWRKLMAAVIQPPLYQMKPAAIYWGRNSEEYRAAA
jgi:hypothetical protein